MKGKWGLNKKWELNEKFFLKKDNKFSKYLQLQS